MERAREGVAILLSDVWLSANEGKNSKILWWNEEVKATLERKNTDWKEVLDTRDEVAKQDV